MDPEKFYLITDRTVNEEHWMLPTKEIKVVGRFIARFQETNRIEIIALSAPSNHCRLVLRAPYGNLSEFEQDTIRETAKRINRHLRERLSLSKTL